MNAKKLSTNGTSIVYSSGILLYESKCYLITYFLFSEKSVESLEIEIFMRLTKKKLFKTALLFFLPLLLSRWFPFVDSYCSCSCLWKINNMHDSSYNTWASFLLTPYAIQSVFHGGLFQFGHAFFFALARSNWGEIKKKQQQQQKLIKTKSNTPEHG